MGAYEKKLIKYNVKINEFISFVVNVFPVLDTNKFFIPQTKSGFILWHDGCSQPFNEK